MDFFFCVDAKGMLAGKDKSESDVENREKPREETNAGPSQTEKGMVGYQYVVVWKKC